MLFLKSYPVFHATIAARPTLSEKPIVWRAALHWEMHNQPHAIIVGLWSAPKKQSAQTATRSYIRISSDLRYMILICKPYGLQIFRLASIITMPSKRVRAFHYVKT